MSANMTCVSDAEHMDWGVMSGRDQVPGPWTVDGDLDDSMGDLVARVR
jgi:hypothetical protein